MGANTNLERMRELIERLTEADIAYYKNDAPIMTDLEYDRLTEDLASLEHDTGLVLSGSPTQKVSGEILESLAEVRHTKPMLSAGKTKSIEDLIRFAAGRAVLLSWKMDGLTLVLRYEYGKLKQAITRGREGRDILFSAGIPYRGRGKGPRLHDLRHTFCVHSLQKLTAHGEDPYAVLPLLMTYMGHRSVQATSQYIHLSAESFPAILKQSEALFGNLIPLEDISNETSI